MALEKTCFFNCNLIVVVVNSVDGILTLLCDVKHLKIYIVACNEMYEMITLVM